MKLLSFFLLLPADYKKTTASSSGIDEMNYFK